MSQKHEIKLNMSLAGTRLYGCAELAKKLRHSTGSKIELLLPIDGSWLPNGEISYESGNSHCVRRCQPLAAVLHAPCVS